MAQDQYEVQGNLQTTGSYTPICITVGAQSPGQARAQVVAMYNGKVNIGSVVKVS